mmetsp:Transcript_73237/g.139198  ORF Transcript_73237/g.139198 Transcript_73237/m.139198 type:complete len:182 (-) Transcript_73237:490-1035(-)
MSWNSWNGGSWDGWTGSDSWGGSDSWSGSTAGYFPERGGGKGSMMSERELANAEWERSHSAGMTANDEDEWAQNRSATHSNPYDFDAKGCNLASSRDLAKRVMQERAARQSDDKRSRSRSRSRSRKKSRKGKRRRRRSSSSRQLFLRRLSYRWGGGQLALKCCQFNEGTRADSHARQIHGR